jgi:hypothetical protein
MAKRNQPKKGTRRRGQGELLPGEYRRHSLVVVDNANFSRDSDEYGRYSSQFAVETRRLDKTWVHTVITFRGDTWIIPAKVFDRLNAQRESIIKQQRSDRAVERQAQLRVVNE